MQSRLDGARTESELPSNFLEAPVGKVVQHETGPVGLRQGVDYRPHREAVYGTVRRHLLPRPLGTRMLAALLAPQPIHGHVAGHPTEPRGRYHSAARIRS